MPPKLRFFNQSIEWIPSYNESKKQTLIHNPNEGLLWFSPGQECAFDLASISGYNPENEQALIHVAVGDLSHSGCLLKWIDVIVCPSGSGG